MEGSTKNMENLKSHAQDQILNLVIETIADAYAFLRLCDSSLVREDDYKRDVAYVTKRVENEGLTFLTVRLPILGDFLDKLMWGELQLQRVEGFKPYDGLYPCFLRPFWIYLEKTRTYDDSATAHMYRILRTLLFGLKKLSLPYTEEQAAAKLASFEAIEAELQNLEIPDNPAIVYMQLLLENVLSGFHADVEYPKHGPGAVAGGERHNEKWTWTVLFESVHAAYPYWEYFFPIRSAIGDGSGRSRSLQLAANVGTYRSLRREAEPTARLLMVPKDSRGPRIISCEPKELMYLQQGVAIPLMKLLERHPYTRGHINFERQDINANLALESSFSRSKDTIDLSDASDRVSCALVKLLFPERLAPRLLALRSSATVLPCGRRLQMTKYAPMGSALCFPIESLVFWAIAVGSIWNEIQDLSSACQAVHVYGDDIIIDARYTNLVMRNLESCGLKVNRDKSFLGSHPFRESCGIEAWKGHNVTPLRVKKLPPRGPTDTNALVAWLKYAENTQKLCPLRSKFELDVVERWLGPIPRVPFPQSYMSIVTECDHWSLKDFRDPKWSSATSYWKAKLYVVKQRRQDSAFPNWSRLQRNLIQRALQGDPSVVVDRASTLINKQYANITYLGL